MAFDSLQDRLTKSLKNIAGKGKLSERNMEDTLKEIRVALLESDVNYSVVQNFLNSIRKEVEGQDVLNAIDPGQLLIKIVHDEIIKLLGDDDNSIHYTNNGLTTIMVVGLQGTGKTTQTAKIAYQMKKEGKKVLMVACDVIRPAAIDQLKSLGASIDVEVYSKGIFVNALNTAIDGLKYAKENNFDVALFDTAGRLQIDETLMKELEDIKAQVNPNEILLTVDALTGQDICNVAKTFNERLAVTGLVVTKFDGDAKGGSVLSVKALTGVPIGAPISNPVWLLTLILLLAPNLDVIVPEIGLIKFKLNGAFWYDIFVEVFTFPITTFLSCFTGSGTTTFSWYKAATVDSTSAKYFTYVSYISIIDNWSILLLFLSLNWFIMLSACEKSLTYAFSSSPSKTA